MRAAGLALVLLACVGPTASAQIAELHAGVVASAGTARSYGGGGGLVLGLSAGRLTYAGLRWAWYAGTTTTVRGLNVRNRTQTYAADVGVVIPLKSAELMPGLSVGVLRFAQRVDSLGTFRHTGRAAEFLFSPGIALEVHLGGALAVIPELQWSLAGQPDLPFGAPHRGPLASVRFVLVREIGRVRR